MIFRRDIKTKTSISIKNYSVLIFFIKSFCQVVRRPDKHRSYKEYRAKNLNRFPEDNENRTTMLSGVYDEAKHQKQDGKWKVNSEL
ncbi:MAG: hypothetical protein H8D23_37670 [Candidatus Brocadiales bacterium]|nr:hypothetical protein [Candidatus Brocadiales bacterium]